MAPLRRSQLELLTLLAVLLCGCVAETVERRRPRKGPVKEVGYVDLGGGRVRYSTEGWGWFVAGRRRHARRLMRKNCGRDLEPVIVDEYTRDDADIAYAGDDITDELGRGSEHYKIAPYQHFLYECRAKPGVSGLPPSGSAPAASTATATSPFIVVPARELLPQATTAAAPVPEPAPSEAPAVSTATESRP